MLNQNLIYRIGLTLVKGIGNITAKQIIETLGDAEPLFREKAHILERIPGITSRIITEIRKPEVLLRAEKEVSFMEKKGISALFITDESYPFRFKESVDSPAMLYFKGNTDLNKPKIISIVGTRNATPYGREMTEKIIRDFAQEYPEIIVISGLAYGVDIIAHKAALAENLPTVGVLAHGLDRIYPCQHKDIAIEMLEKGGLLTDFISETNPDRQNFVKRNRIVAGISDCTIVIESATKGGAMITANIANSYNKDVFALPGKVHDLYSRGCNALIKSNRAALVENAGDVMITMGWTQQNEARPKVIQRTILKEFSPDEQMVVDLLGKTECMHLNILAIELNIPVSKLSVTLFELEMDGVVRALPGGMYRLV